METRRNQQVYIGNDALLIMGDTKINDVDKAELLTPILERITSKIKEAEHKNDLFESYDIAELKRKLHVFFVEAARDGNETCLRMLQKIQPKMSGLGSFEYVFVLALQAARENGHETCVNILVKDTPEFRKTAHF